LEALARSQQAGDGEFEVGSRWPSVIGR